MELSFKAGKPHEGHKDDQASLLPSLTFTSNATPKVFAACRTKYRETKAKLMVH